MTSEATFGSSMSESLPLARLVMRALAWGEVFVLIPLHAFWILFKSTPFVAENTSSAFVAAVPLGVMVGVGLAVQSRRIRAALLQIEWLLHLTTALCMALLLVYVTLRDPFSPGVPITWPLCFWSVCIAFALLSNLALHERMRGHSAEAVSGAKCVWTIATVLAVWGILVWLAADMAWSPHFWTASLVFHVAMAPVSRRAAGRGGIAAVARGGRLTSATAFVEGAFMGALLLAALLRFAFTSTMAATAELRYFELVHSCATPWFLTGAVLALIAGRLRFAFAAHALAMGVFLSTGTTAGWPISFVMGYGLATLFLAATRQGALAYAISAALVTGIWTFALLAHALSGVIVLTKMGLGLAEGLATGLRVAVVVLYVAWLVLAGMNAWRGRYRAAIESDPSDRGNAWAYAAVWVVILLPIGVLIATTMGHTIRFERALRVEVGQPSGICHAGYSRSDEEYALIGELGARLTRIPIYWAQVQPDADTWNFEDIDAFLDAAEKHHVKVVAVFGFDNNAVEQSVEGSKRSIAPEDLPLFLEYVRRTMERYKHRVYAWEIWNEPDLPLFYQGTMDEFYNLARCTAATVREVHPEALLLGTAMTSLLGARSAPGIEGLHASGALAQVDHPSMHTYVSDPRAYYNEFLRVRNAAAKYGHPGSIWITELGAPDGGVYPWRTSSGFLAEHAMKAYMIATSMGIETVLWHTLKDADLESLQKDPLNSEGFFGLVKDGDQWKPAGHAYTLFAKHCENSVIRADLVKVSGGIAARQLRTALYRRDDGESALVLWFEPGLRRRAHAGVAIDLGALEEPAVMHDITSSYSKHLFDGLVDVTERPLFITFRPPDPKTPVRLDVDGSPADGAWLLLAAGLVLWAARASARQALRP